MHQIKGKKGYKFISAWLIRAIRASRESRSHVRSSLVTILQGYKRHIQLSTCHSSDLSCDLGESFRGPNEDCNTKQRGYLQKRQSSRIEGGDW